MKTKAYIGNCPNCGRECMSGLKTTSCWNCETEFTIPTDMQEISYVNSTSIESKGCDNEKAPCEDAISRRAVLNEIPILWNSNGDKDYCMESLRDFVAELPPLTPQPKTGHWIEEKSIHGWDGKSFVCSECGRSIHIDSTVEDLSDYPYCHCGAKMVESQESEE